MGIKNIQGELRVNDEVVATQDWVLNPRELAIMATVRTSNRKIELQNLTGMTWIDWGDGTINSELTHTYDANGDYVCKIYGATEIHHSIFKKGSIINLVIDNTITNIGTSAFTYQNILTNVTIGNSVRSIGESAFHECDGLTNIVIPDSVTRIGRNAFWSCSRLQNVVIGNGVTSIEEYAFRECSNLTNVTIGSGVTSIGNLAFWNCTSLTNVYIADLAAWCNISFGGDYDTNPLDYAKNLYVNNELVTELIIPNTVTEIKDFVFYQCGSLTSVVIPDSVTSIGERAFYNCINLTNVTIGNGVNSIGALAFLYCSNLTSVEIGSGLASIGNKAFHSCSNLTNIIVSENNTTYQSIDGSLYSKDGKVLIQCAIDKTITTFVFPDSVIVVNDLAFSNCDNLEYNIKDDLQYLGNNENPYFYLVGTISKDITTTTIDENCKIIGGEAFRNCSDLTSIKIPDSVISICKGAFYNCSSLMSVYITEMKAWCNILFGNHYANPLYYAKNLYLNSELVTELDIPKGVTSINDFAFICCDSLIKAIIPDSTTSIGLGAFAYCHNLAEIIIPDSVTSIGERTFIECASLIRIEAPDKIVSIGERAFEKCNNATAINFGKNVGTIGIDSFLEMSALTSVTFKNLCPIKYQDYFSTTTNLQKIIVPYDSIGAYKAKWAEDGAPEEVLNLIVGEEDPVAYMSDVNALETNMQAYVQQYIADNFATLMAQYLNSTEATENKPTAADISTVFNEDEEA